MIPGFKSSRETSLELSPLPAGVTATLQALNLAFEVRILGGQLDMDTPSE